MVHLLPTSSHHRLLDTLSGGQPADEDKNAQRARCKRCDDVKITVHLDGRVDRGVFRGRVILGIVLLVFTWALKRIKPSRFHSDFHDYYWFLGLGAIGGVLTAFFSVGVGELIAVYMILRKFPTTSAIAVAVVVSALTVISERVVWWL